jgi:hypothetical protein
MLNAASRSSLDSCADTRRAFYRITARSAQAHADEREDFVGSKPGSERHFLSPASQLSTTVIGSAAVSSTGLVIRNRRPSPEGAWRVGLVSGNRKQDVRDTRLENVGRIIRHAEDEKRFETLGDLRSHEPSTLSCLSANRQFARHRWSPASAGPSIARARDLWFRSGRARIASI